MITVLMFCAALVVLIRVICLAANLDRARWTGPLHQYFALASGHALLGGGAVAALILSAWAPMLLLVGAALIIISDRRRPV